MLTTMADASRSLEHRSPTFIISAGTQVVLKVSEDAVGRPVPQAGAVGSSWRARRTTPSRTSCSLPTAQTAPAYFRELVLRRKEVEAELGSRTDDLRPYIIYRCQVGSKAYGLADDDADDDLRGIYLPPARLDWSLYRLPEQIESQTETHDEVYWELEKFLLLALKANPNVLETLWTPLVLEATPLADELRAMRSGVPLAALVQDVLWLRAEPVPPDGGRRADRRPLQAQARDAPGAAAVLGHPRACRRAKFWSMSRPAARSCCGSSAASCRLRKSNSWRWHWSASFRPRLNHAAARAARFCPRQ